MDRKEVEAKPGIGRGRACGRLRTTSPLGRQSPTPIDRSGALSSSDGSHYTSDASSSPSTNQPLSAGMSTLSVSGETTGDLGKGFPRGARRGHLHHPEQEQEIEKRDREREAKRDFVKSRPDGLKKQGEKGREIPLKANYYRLKSIPSWHLHQYSAQFSVEEDRVGVRKKLFRTYVIENKIELGYMFDGAQLFTSKTLEQAGLPASFTSQLDREGDQPVTISLNYVGVVDHGSPIYVQLYNILIRKCLFTLDLQQMGRNFFDGDAAIKLPKEKLELWPGYITSMRAHENDVLLCIETTTKVLRMDSVQQLIQRTQNSARGDPKTAIKEEFKDTIVMTTYNRKTYHVDDIDFDLTPRSTFMRKGVETCYAEYYESKYGLKIKDLNQPLIISNPRGRDLHRGDNKPAILVPELCQSDGLTDAMRSNFTLMKDLAKYLHQMPKEKVSVIEKFMRRLQENELITKEFENWGLHFDGKLVDLNGRVMSNETMVFATGTQPVDLKGDFTMAFRSQQMLTAVQMTNWVVLVPARDAGGVDNLVRTMSKVASPLSMRIANPKQTFSLPDIKPQTYLRQIDDAVKTFKDLQMLFVILPNNGLPLYAAVKKRLAVDLGIPSQCFLAKNVTSKGLMSIATKVVVQMNAKLGGEPWTVKLPMKNTMFIGFDVHTGGKGTSGGSIGAMVATFSPTFSRYFSTTSVYRDSDDMAKNIRTDVKKCLFAYREANGTFPDKIFMYRDGVGNGQLKMVYDVELKSIKEELSNTYAAERMEPPSLTYIVVTKRINTKLFQVRGPNLDNPPPGTVVDSVVTLPERYDFYLISCGARQGTVSPCSYNVLIDESGFDADRIQLITYKMCHMYYNWSGTIAVPAPCQYAHKLAFLTGMAYAGQANQKLSKLLHFL